jgi:signal transduction histidine kinase
MTTMTLAPTARRSLLEQLGADSRYVLTGFPLALVSFVLLLTGLLLGAGLLVTLLGIPVAVFTLRMAGVFAALERARLPQVLGHPVTPPGYRRTGGRGLGYWLRALRDPQRWLDTAHGIVVMPLSLVTWTLAVTWWALPIGGFSYPLWYWALPQDGNNLPELLGLPGLGWEIAFYVTAGLVGTLTLPFVLRACAVLQAGLGREFLANERVTALQQRVETLTVSRQAAAEAEADARRRLERDLHDGPQQRLLRLAMDLSTAERKLADDPQAARPLVAAALGEARETLEELRALSRGFAPAVLNDRGLDAALSSLAARSIVPVTLDVDLGRERPPAPVEQAAYHVVAEALTNVAKHSGAGHAEVRVRLEQGRLVASVTDDGGGGAHPAKGHGLVGLGDRLAGLDGTLSIDSPPGGPTVITATLPCG